MKPTQPSVFTFELGTPEGSLRTTLRIPSESMRLSDLARSVMRLDDDLVALGLKKHLPIVGPPSCKKGCASCCDQLVPISIPEVFMIHDLVSAMPEARQEEVLTRIVASEEVLESLGIDAFALSDTKEQSVRQLLVEYHRSGTTCAFLDKGSCSIYTSRPASCREYLVSSPAENCAKIGEVVVTRIPISIRMAHALSGVAARVLGNDPLLVPLAFAIAWAEQHEEIGQRKFDGCMLVNMLLEELSAKPNT
ncbi:MAG: YkgJ family cysteine cluster protein [Polyangiaceae bacterium]|nr:YkgJ family cysteine cluster protein [Polyangiaceae bacterium]